MKSTTNAFLEGLRMDLHPLATSQKQLTDALNATLVTFNGNEMMLLNDMGNTLIQDSATGNIMGLNPGFIPIGIKEHGGIMYIASVNKDGDGEIGTIPSPIIRDFYKRKNTLSVSQYVPINSGLVQVSNKIYPADKFLMNLQLSFGRDTSSGFEYYGSDIVGIKHFKDSLLSDNTNGLPNYDPSDLILERKVICQDTAPVLELVHDIYPHGIGSDLTFSLTHPEGCVLYASNISIEPETLYGDVQATLDLGSTDVWKLELENITGSTDYKNCGYIAPLFKELNPNKQYIFSAIFKPESKCTLYVDLKKSTTDPDPDPKPDPDSDPVKEAYSSGYIFGYNAFKLESGNEYKIKVIGFPPLLTTSAVHIIYELVSTNGTHVMSLWDLQLTANLDSKYNNTVFDPSSYSSIYTPLISYNDDKEEANIFNIGKNILLFSTKGVYELSLYSCGLNLDIKADESLLTPLLYELGGNTYSSKYWYVHHDIPNNIFPKDLLNVTLNGGFKLFPTEYKPGYLSVRLNTEEVGEFNILPRKKDPFNTPITVLWPGSDDNVYYSYFPGFYYTTNSGLYIDKLDNITVTNESTGEQVLLFLYDDSLDSGSKTITRYFRHDGSFTNSGGTLVEPEYMYAYSQNSRFLHTDPLLLDVWNTHYKSQGPQQLFQKRVAVSGEDKNVFLLTSVANINSHKSTELESSSVDFDEKPHPGLFCAEIGGLENYNNWFRLDLDYYDQYDGLQGHFSARFNPYLNDVFGTNTDASDVEYADFYTIGKSKTFSCPENAQTLTYKPEGDVMPHTRGLGDFPTGPNGGGYVGRNKNGSYPVLGPTNYRDGFGCSADRNLTDSATRKYTAEGYTEFKDAFEKYITGDWLTSKYIYGPNYLQSVYDGMTVSGGITYAYSHINIKNAPSLVYYDSRKDSADGVGGYGQESTLSYTSADIAATKLLDSSLAEVSMYSDSACKTKINLPPLAGASGFKNWYFKNKKATSNPIFQINKKPVTSFFESLSPNSLKDTYNVTVAGYTSLFDSLFPDDFTGHKFKHSSPDLIVWYDKGSFIVEDFYTMPSFTYSLKPSVTINPAFKISPYFTLKSDDGGYVFKFNGVFYKSNFETDSFGIPYNYSSVTISHDEGTPSNAILSYRADTGANLLDIEYLTKEINISERLDAGIYVFYIQRCPCTSFWTTLDLKAEPSTPHGLRITINGIEFSTNPDDVIKGSYGYTSLLYARDWRYIDPKIPASDDVYILYSGDGDTHWNDSVHKTNEIGSDRVRIYTPHVIVLPTPTEVNIKVTSESDSAKQSYLKYQTFGLFRIDGVSEADVKSLHPKLKPFNPIDSEKKPLVASSPYVWTHLDYMNLILKLGESLEGTVLLYNFIQKYGVFFRSCYAFMDGNLKRFNNGNLVLYDDPSTGEGIDLSVTIYNHLLALRNPYNDDGVNAYPADNTTATHFHTGPFIPDNAYTIPGQINNGAYILLGYVRAYNGSTAVQFIPENPGTGISPQVIKKISY